MEEILRPVLDRLQTVSAELRQIRDSFLMNLFEKKRFESLSANLCGLQESTDNVEGKTYKVKDETVHLTVQGSACDMKCKYFGVENTPDEPTVPAYPGFLKINPFVVEYGADEPSVQVSIGVLKAQSFYEKDEADEPNVPAYPGVLRSNTYEVEERDEGNVQVSSGVLKDKAFYEEDEADEPNVEACLDNVKDKAFGVKCEATKPNFLSAGCYTPISVLIIALLLPVAYSSFVEAPKNSVVFERDSSGAIDLACKSDCQCNLKWFAIKNHVFQRELLFNGYALYSDAKSYCTVLADEPGKCHLNLRNKPEAAQTYFCFEPGTLAEASADLVWIGDLISNDSSTEGYVNLTCGIEFRGNWAPIMEWKEHNSHSERVLSVGVNTVTVSNQRVASTLVMEVQTGSRNYTCTAKFDISGKPSNTTATNVPDYNCNWTSSVFLTLQDEMATESGTATGTIVGIVIGIIVIAGVTFLIVRFIKGNQWNVPKKKKRCRMPTWCIERGY